jgi:hypothetical protein
MSQSEANWYTLTEWFSSKYFDPGTLRKHKNLLNRVRLAVDLVNFVIIINIENQYLLNSLSSESIIVQQEVTGEFRLKTNITEESVRDPHLSHTLVNKDSRALTQIILSLIIPKMGNFLFTDATLAKLEGKDPLPINQQSQRESLQNIYNNIKHFVKTITSQNKI